MCCFYVAHNRTTVAVYIIYILIYVLNCSRSVRVRKSGAYKCVCMCVFVISYYASCDRVRTFISFHNLSSAPLRRCNDDAVVETCHSECAIALHGSLRIGPSSPPSPPDACRRTLLLAHIFSINGHRWARTHVHRANALGVRTTTCTHTHTQICIHVPCMRTCSCGSQSNRRCGGHFKVRSLQFEIYFLRIQTHRRTNVRPQQHILIAVALGYAPSVFITANIFGYNAIARTVRGWARNSLGQPERRRQRLQE